MSIESVIQSLVQSKDEYASREPFLHRCRVELEPFVYSYLKDTYGDELRRNWESCTIPLESNRAIVIVERRCHPNLEFTLHNAVYFARGYSLHIVCSQANLAFVEEICGSKRSSIHIHPAYTTIGSVDSGKREYNELLKSCGFWNTFTEDYILCMETDSYLLRQLPVSICNYSYVASKWHWVPGQAGGGGISHRKRSFMLEICSLSSLRSIEMQDTYASEGLLLLGYPVCDDTIFGETEIELEMCGTHQWWTFVGSVSHDELRPYLSFLLTLHVDKT
jgi:hypothetical protein